jgi:uroporphyrinogen-III synthase
MRVLVTRPAAEAAEWTRELRSRGFDAQALPLIAIQPVPDVAPIGDAWAQLGCARAVMFVSGNAVREFFAHRPPGASWPVATRAWATGPGTRQALLRQGVAPGLVDAPSADASQFDSETLWRQVGLQVRADDALLIVRGAGGAGADREGRDWLADRLRARKAQVRTVVAYLRVAPVFTDEERALAEASADAAWLFSSSEAIGNLAAWLPARSWARAQAVATHPRIAQAARDASFGVVCLSRPSVDAVADALESIR